MKGYFKKDLPTIQCTRCGGYVIEGWERRYKSIQYCNCNDRIRGQNVVFPNDPTAMGCLPQTRQGEKGTS